MTEPEPTKDDLLSQIFLISTTLTEEAMAAAAAKASELSFDTNRGVVPLAESFINLSSARAVLEDAIEKRKLVQLPITVQREIFTILGNIRTALQGLTTGSDEVVNLTNAIEVLNTSIWKYGLHNLSDQVLGYQTKLNQLKNQEVKISKLVRELERAGKVTEEATAAVATTEKAKTDAVERLEQIKQASDRATALLQDVTTAQTQVATLFSAVQQHEKQSGELASSIKTAHNDLSALDSSIRKFYGEVDTYRKTIAETTDAAGSMVTSGEAASRKLVTDSATKIDEVLAKLDVTITEKTAVLKETVDDHVEQVTAQLDGMRGSTKNELTTLRTNTETQLTTALGSIEGKASKLTTDSELAAKNLLEGFNKQAEETVGANKEATDALILELGKLKDQIREQIQQATGFSLFGAFQARQNALVSAKHLWSVAILVLLVVSVAVTTWIAYEAQSYTAGSLAFWVKLSLTLPLGFAITFCAVQYGRERRLEEEYAFKSSISVSLTPYRDLVLSILEKDPSIDKSKYTDFVIESVKNVFTPPTDKVFDSHRKEAGLTQKAFKQTAEVIGAGIKAAK